MTLNEVFDQLLLTKQIALCLPRQTAENLRVSLIRKFKDYKEQTEKLGWLSDDLAVSVVSMEYDSDALTAKYFLRPRKRQQATYTLLPVESTEPTAATESYDKE